MMSKINTWGNSYAVRIPKAAIDKLRLSKGAPVLIASEGEKITITPVKKDELTLADVLSEISPANLHGEIMSDRAVGREIW